MAVRNGCGGGALSPDGRFLACLEVTDEGATGYFNTQLTLFDVATGEPAFKKTRSFPLPTHTPGDPLALLRALVRSGGFSLVFSPDARYFVLGYADGETVVDVSARVEARLPAEIRRVFRGSFAFVGTDRVAVVDAERPDHSALVKFPSGDPIRTLTLTGRVDAATRGDYLLVRLAQTVAIVDIAQDKVIGASNSSSLDIYDTYRVAEQPNGDLALYGAESTRPMAVAALPRALLGDMSGSSISQGLKWVSLSAADRGGLWNLETGRRALLVRGFTSSGVAPDGTLYADFPHDKRIVDGKVVDLPRMLTRVTADGHATEVSPLGGIAARISNQFLTVMTAERPDAPDAYNRRATLSVLEIATRTPLWARNFPNETPKQLVDAAHGRVIFEWPVATEAARTALAADPPLKAAADAQHLKGGDAYLEIVDLATGRSLGKLVIATDGDARRIRSAGSDGDEVVLTDNRNQVTAYSMSTNRRLGSVFGDLAILSIKSGLLCVQNEPGHVVCHDPQSLARLSELMLPRPVRLAAFSEDGSRLVTVTSDQMVRVFAVSKLRESSASSQRP